MVGLQQEGCSETVGDVNTVASVLVCENSFVEH